MPPPTQSQETTQYKMAGFRSVLILLGLSSNTAAPTPFTVSPGGGKTRLALQVYDAPGGNMLADWSHKATGTKIERNEHGVETISAFIPMTVDEAFRWHDRGGAPHVSLNYGGGVVGVGRLEDAPLVDGGINITAYGYWRALKDVLYTALWSTTDYSKWTELTELYGIANVTDELYDHKNEGQLHILSKYNTNYAANSRGGYLFQIPDKSSKESAALMFSYKIYTHVTPAAIAARVTQFSSDLSSSITAWTYTPTAATAQSGAAYISLTAGYPHILIEIYATGTWSASNINYLKITDLRIVTDTTNEINTTIAASITAGTRIVTPASMTSIYIGQKLVIDDATSSEIVEVTAVTSTTFTATFANSYGAKSTVKAPLVYADTIASDLATYINGINSSQLSASAVLINSPRLDLTDEIYEDKRPADILNGLAELGDNATPPNRWEVGVDDEQRLFFRIRGSNGQDWYVNAEQLDVNRTLDNLYNAVYATYQDANRRTLRTAVNTDSNSVSANDITRQDVVKANTTIIEQAQIHRDTRLEDTKDITPTAKIGSVKRLLTASGAQVPAWMARPGSTLTIRNLPPGSGTLDKIRTFVIARTSYNVDADEVEPIPGAEPPELEFLIARNKLQQ